MISKELQQFESHVGKWVVESKIPGVAIATAKEGNVDYAQGFGYRNEEKGLPMKADTFLGIGSVTKAYTCVAIMQLAEQGRLAVDDPVVKHLPKFRLKDAEHGKQVTIHHLMTHTSGLPSLPYLARGMHRSLQHDPATKYYPFRWTEADTPIDTYDQLLDAIATTDYDLLDGPGKFFCYSNESYALLGAIIEAVSGQPYEDYVRDHLLRPAGLHDTDFVSRGLDDDERATELYTMDPEKKEPVATPGWWQSYVFSAAGFLYSTVGDVARFMDLYRTGGLIGDVRVLSEASVAAIVKPHVRCDVNQFYGYGVMITPNYHGVTLIEHGGDIKGAAAMASCVPELGRTFAGLSNLGASPTTKLVTGGIHAFAGVPLDQSRIVSTGYTVSDDELARYTGTFESGEGAEVTVRVANGGLVLSMQGQTEDIPAEPYSKDAFAVSLGGREVGITFQENADGDIAWMSFGYRTIPKVR